MNTITILAQYTAAVSPAGGHSKVINIFCLGAALTLILNMRYKLHSVYGILTADSRGSLADAGLWHSRVLDRDEAGRGTGSGSDGGGWVDTGILSSPQ